MKGRKHKSNKIIDNYLNKILKSTNKKLAQNYYEKIHKDYNKLMIENLMCNGKCHTVAVFKDYLIQDDLSEFLRRFYKQNELKTRLKKLFQYYDETSVIFPNYTPIEESKYIYKNIMKKQKVIDEQQDQEDKREFEIKHKKEIEKSKKNDKKVFNSTAYDDILNGSESLLRIVFGIDKHTAPKDLKNSTDKYLSTDNNLINKIRTYNDSVEEVNNLINIITKTEESQNNIIDYRTTAIKTKIKLNNNHQKFNSIVTNSTTLTSNSNMNSIIAPKKNNSKNELDYKIRVNVTNSTINNNASKKSINKVSTDRLTIREMLLKNIKQEDKDFGSPESKYLGHKKTKTFFNFDSTGSFKKDIFYNSKFKNSSNDQKSTIITAKTRNNYYMGSRKIATLIENKTENRCVNQNYFSTNNINDPNTFSAKSLKNKTIFNHRQKNNKIAKIPKLDIQQIKQIDKIQITDKNEYHTAKGQTLNTIVAINQISHKKQDSNIINSHRAKQNEKLKLMLDNNNNVFSPGNGAKTKPIINRNTKTITSDSNHYKTALTGKSNKVKKKISFYDNNNVKTNSNQKLYNNKDYYTERNQGNKKKHI